MVGAEAEHSGIIRAGARFVEAMATADRPQDSSDRQSRVAVRAITRWPDKGLILILFFRSPRAAWALWKATPPPSGDLWHADRKLKNEGEPSPEIEAEMKTVRETYDRELDAKHAAARGLVDAIVTPENLRDSLISLCKLV